MIQRSMFVLIGLVVLGCSGAPAVTPEPTAPPPTLPTPSPTPQPTPEPTSVPPALGGDAATNPTCGLMTPGEVADVVAAGITKINGLTGPGAYALTSSDCTWFLDSGEAGIPSVNVQWEYPVGHWHDPVLDLYKDAVKQGLAVAIPELGDYAILEGHNAEAIEGHRIVRVSVIKNLTDADKDAAVALLKLILPRTVDIPSASP